MNQRYFAIRVFGCQMNVYDADRLRETLTSRGWAEGGEGDADFVIFVTCSVRDKAEQKVLSELGKYRASWEDCGKPRIALLGCMAARTGAEVAKKFPWIRVVAGPENLGGVADAMEESYEGGAPRLITGDTPELSCVPLSRSNRHKAYITIANGCDQFCAYCIVPYVRGRFKSRPPEDILKEAETLVRGGAAEITLLGQNVNTYGRDLTGSLAGYGFSRLLADTASIDGLKRLRYLTSHPSDFTDDILDVMTSRRNICPGINLPVQAGSDKVLREMNRRYTRNEYISLARGIRAALPHAALTTDLIVGFPGETEDEFEQSVSLLEEVRFDLVHTAAYSPREGTPAAKRADQIPVRERARRLVRINGIQTEISREINERMVGHKFEVLLDEPAPKGEGLLQGRTAADKVVLVSAPPDMSGKFRDVLITASSPWCLDGEII
ncbi:MAG: tRNA (N6-isopentenyl adenosine(37)-C2)-methylthiotransferase MiaB [Synergistaceae bacterium]|nr:tRNA (N6-isopentenyl adenosine(37)-C2)-methylthiotransferase MiaB [Synergistaceae bacterium]